MFTKAIVRRPARFMINGITAHPELGKPDHELAVRQHDAYIAALERCGLSVEVLPALEGYPDSCFVEDVAVCTRRFALVTLPREKSRSGEIAGMDVLLGRHFPVIESIKAPGTLEGGDVMMIGDAFYIGLSSRTNAEGARQFIGHLERYGLEGHTVCMPPTLHLKSGLSYLEDGWLLVESAFAGLAEFSGFKRIDIMPAEAYAANCIRINDFAIVPAGYPKALADIKATGIPVIELDMSEFRKIDGSLTCLSLRF
ncbi:MAG: N(G),N(G)-dimethylarginine dimethylaminohydrolase [Spirochaetae bacterium HGW-Spirochaetae-7]|jgi:dimethylargininase|nr:MAG: N(G),N(G)-dimethylarginine dimethylaminohydrolase [Spirochaetae bacterium HGW-Spirochaetae-7]